MAFGFAAGKSGRRRQGAWPATQSCKSIEPDRQRKDTLHT